MHTVQNERIKEALLYERKSRQCNDTLACPLFACRLQAGVRSGVVAPGPGRRRRGDAVVGRAEPCPHLWPRGRALPGPGDAVAPPGGGAAQVIAALDYFAAGQAAFLPPTALARRRRGLYRRGSLSG